jgi:hypothetical protein
MKPGNLNFLEPSGPLQACNGTAKIVLKFLAYYVIQTFRHYLKQTATGTYPEPLKSGHDSNY